MLSNTNSAPNNRQTQKIEVLPPVVAERIAAGEVIERPASVVKELVENSLDAQATEITVILEDGGKKLIEIIDNGWGMSAPDLERCVLRHATSKLRTLDDLDRIQSLGFRGEALASVAAVADLSILSRPQGEKQAHELRLPDTQAQAVTFGHFHGANHGTRIRAQGLFSQIPARLKFLKAARSEVTQVREWMERLAVTRPAVGFRIVSDDRTVLDLRPSSTSDPEAARVRQILSDGGDFPVVTREHTSLDGSVRARAHWIHGFSSPQTRKILQVVNGRVLRDRLIQQAVLSAFRQALLPGQFPAMALYLELDPSQVDVNVHPTKTEVRFLNSSQVFREVQSLVEAMIAEQGSPVRVPETSKGWFVPPVVSPAVPLWSTPPTQPAAEQISLLRAADSSPEISSSPSHPLSEARYVGIVFNTYIAYEAPGEELVLIDQHAAHERVRYETLRMRAGDLNQSQELLIPEAVKFPVERRLDVENRLVWLEDLGFACEIFGEDTLLFRSIPAVWGTSALRTRLRNLLDRALNQELTDSTPLMDEVLFEKLASEACRSSVFGGDRLLEPEARSLVDKLFQCDHPWNCPHGRPTVVRIPAVKFEEWFLRRV